MHQSDGQQRGDVALPEASWGGCLDRQPPFFLLSDRSGARIAEIDGLWGSRLRRGIDSRSAAATLRRWAAYGLLDVVRKGTSHREGLYTKPQ